MIKIMAKKGFTALETVLVVTIIALLFGLAANYYTNSQIRADLNVQAANIASHLRLAQSKASSGLNDSKHGIHFENSAYTIFQGDSYSALESTNFEVTLPETITVSNIALSGGGSDVLFLQNGETENSGTIALTSENIGKTITIQIDSSGLINY